jgi:rare lipoprotein A (peptidoglycan hydrolase)
MFSILPALSVAVAIASTASGLILPRHRAISLPARSAPVAAQPADYAAGYLEPYKTYHLRYLAIGCQNKHNSSYFDKCCHPLLATENVKDNRPAECTPSAAQMSSASSALPTSTVIPDAGGADGCDDDGASSTSTPTSTPSAKVAAPKNIGHSPPEATSKTTTKATPKATPKKEDSSSKTHSSTKTHTSSTSKPSPGGGGGGESSGDSVTGGVATFFTQNGVAGACGTKHQDSDLIAAIDQARYGSSSKKSPLCGKKVHITNKSNKKSVTVTIADDCPTCKNKNSIDLSEAAFKQIATEEEGEVEIVWSFVE